MSTLPSNENNAKRDSAACEQAWHSFANREPAPDHKDCFRGGWVAGKGYARDSDAHETSELQRALHVIDEAGKLSDWINRARPVVTDLMAAYERRIRTDCTPEQIAKEPWRCMEYIGAENLLRDQPIAVVELTAQKAGEQ